VESLIGPGKAIDTNRWWVVCSNVLGGSGGSTGPGSPHPDHDGAWDMAFPTITIGDMVAAQAPMAFTMPLRSGRMAPAVVEVRSAWVVFAAHT